MRCVLVLALCATGCSQKVAAPDGPVARDSGLSRDIDTTPRVGLGIINHLHMRTDHPADLIYSGKVWVEWTSDAVAVKAAVQGGIALSRRGGASVPITIKVTTNGDYQVSVTPVTPLPSDTDYVVELVASGLLKAQGRARALFRVGSAPRIRDVSAHMMPAGLVIGLGFSESIVPQSVFKALTITTADGTPITATASGSATLASSVGVLLDSALLGKKLRLRIERDIGAPGGGKLDGDYSGNVKGTPFELEFVPADIQLKAGKAAWEPTITF